MNKMSKAQIARAALKSELSSEIDATIEAIRVLEETRYAPSTNERRHIFDVECQLSHYRTKLENLRSNWMGEKFHLSEAVTMVKVLNTKPISLVPKRIVKLDRETKKARGR